MQSVSLLHADTRWDYDDRVTCCDVGWLSHRRDGAKRSGRPHPARSHLCRPRGVAEVIGESVGMIEKQHERVRSLRRGT